MIFRVVLGAALAIAVAGFGYHEESSTPFVAESFVPYFSYDGELEVSGYVKGVTIGTAHVLEYSLSDVDPLCVDGASTMPNSCGIHFHAEMTCDDDAGGHYFSSTLPEDPWATVSYVAVEASGDYIASGVEVSVETGLTAEEIVGHAFVVHGYDGGRIACAIIM